MGVHALEAVAALPAGRDARDDDAIPDGDLGHSLTDLGHDADPFVTEDASVLHGGNVPLEDVQIRPADRRRLDLDDRVCGLLNLRSRHLLPGDRTRTLIHHGLHVSSLEFPAQVETHRPRRLKEQQGPLTYVPWTTRHRRLPGRLALPAVDQGVDVTTAVLPNGCKKLRVRGPLAASPSCAPQASCRRRATPITHPRSGAP